MKKLLLFGLILGSSAQAAMSIQCDVRNFGGDRTKDKIVTAALHPYYGDKRLEGHFWIAEVEMQLDKSVTFKANAEVFVEKSEKIQNKKDAIMRSSLTLSNGDVIGSSSSPANNINTNSTIDGVNIQTSCNYVDSN